MIGGPLLIDGELSSRPLAGGDLGRARWVETTAGPVVEKTYPDPPAGLVAAEAAGLEWLRVDDGPPVPAVRAHDRTTIVLDAVVEGAPSAGGAEALGSGLARTHDAGAPSFGWSPSGVAFVGTVGLGVGSFDAWAPFWRARTSALLELLPDADRGPFDRLGERLESLVPASAPARAHGDLWSGNLLWAADGTAWLIDPAAHGAHRELDLALLALFGAPHLERILAAYEEAAGSRLAAGWRARLPLHQIHTLLFHAYAFGGGYLARALDAVRRYL